uniref:Uncharacterized protein n=1 Tax=Arundo donax TaxID=35708 RepID=A0A0A8ZPP0_ARUDO
MQTSRHPLHLYFFLPTQATEYSSTTIIQL